MPSARDVNGLNPPFSKLLKPDDDEPTGLITFHLQAIAVTVGAPCPC
jgi:hypothetical protein